MRKPTRSKKTSKRSAATVVELPGRFMLPESVGLSLQIFRIKAASPGLALSHISAFGEFSNLRVLHLQGKSMNIARPFLPQSQAEDTVLSTSMK